MPSCPEMPTPMSAAWIIPTSLAPSPIASVVHPADLTSLVTRAFCKGETRQQITAAHKLPASRNLALRSSVSAQASAWPSMIMACSPSPSPPRALAITSPSCLPTAACPSSLASTLSPLPSAAKTSGVSEVTLCATMSLRRSEHAKPMFMAVSLLSPVSTHSLMPARARTAMQSGTPSCSLSSMAVEPRRVRSFSISSCTVSRSSSCPCTVLLAATKRSCHPS
mmetsp:Transcript_71799/g.226843  ORF Transcript_71799/g.226843 Transcript_71799/m.226843 type:complete len:223 (-) Transcript_71799:112-780(-)